MMYSEKALRKVLAELRKRRISEEKAYLRLKHLPYEAFDYARVDHHRHFRKGLPEVIYAPGKTPDQIQRIARSILKSGQPLLITRLEAPVYRKLKRTFPLLRYSRQGRVAYKAGRAGLVNSRLGPGLARRPQPQYSPGIQAPGEWPSVARSLDGRLRQTPIAILTAGTSDIPVAEEAAVTLELMGRRVERIYDCGVAAIHRLFDKLPDLERAGAIICVAGMEGALPSVVAGLVSKPVIAVPTSVGYGAHFKGLTSLLAMMNSCAQGIAVVNIDNGFGAACFASMIS